MPERRKSREEWSAEIDERVLDGEDDAADEPADDGTESLGQFTAFTEEQRQTVNDLFGTLHDAGFMTAGSFRLDRHQGDPDTVTLTVIVDDDYEPAPTDGG